MLRQLDIAVVGCGIGGMSAAAFLARQGHHVSLIERFGEPKPIGAGLLLQPTGLAALVRLGVAPAVTQSGQPIRHLFGQTDQQTTVFDVHYNHLHPDLTGLGIHRAALFQHMLDQALAEDVTLLTGIDVMATELEGDKRFLRTVNGDRLGGYDLVVDATGMRSVLRPGHLIRKQTTYPYGAVWAVVRCDTDVLATDRLEQRYVEAHRMIGTMPIGETPNDDRLHATFFWSLPEDQVRNWHSADFGAFRSDVLSLWPEIEPLVDQLSGTDDLTPALYDDVRLKSPIADRYVAIGDAAHGMSPQLGQGANLAIQDGEHLALALSEGDVTAGLRAYVSRRHWQVAFYQAMSRWMTPFFQSDSRWAAKARDLSFRHLYRLPIMRGEMLRTLAGMKTSLISAKSARAVLHALPQL